MCFSWATWLLALFFYFQVILLHEASFFTFFFLVVARDSLCAPEWMDVLTDCMHFYWSRKTEKKSIMKLMNDWCFDSILYINSFRFYVVPLTFNFTWTKYEAACVSVHCNEPVLCHSRFFSLPSVVPSIFLLLSLCFDLFSFGLTRPHAPHTPFARALNPFSCDVARSSLLRHSTESALSQRV